MEVVFILRQSSRSALAGIEFAFPLQLLKWRDDKCMSSGLECQHKILIGQTNNTSGGSLICVLYVRWSSMPRKINEACILHMSVLTSVC